MKIENKLKTISKEMGESAYQKRLQGGVEGLVEIETLGFSVIPNNEALRCFRAITCTWQLTDG